MFISHARGDTRLYPISCVVAEATSTTEISIAIPSNTRVVQIASATAKHYFTITDSDTPPDLGESNSGVIQIAGEIAFPIKPEDGFTHLHVAATASTGTVDVTFWR